MALLVAGLLAVVCIWLLLAALRSPERWRGLDELHAAVAALTLVVTLVLALTGVLTP